MNHRKISTDGIDCLGEFIAEAYRQNPHKIPAHLKPPYARLTKTTIQPRNSTTLPPDAERAPVAHVKTG